MPKKKVDIATIKPVRKTEFVRPNFLSIYSNHIQLRQTASDLAIIFGEITDASPERAEITQRAQVMLSWMEAKALGIWVTEFVSHYEKANGTIQTEFKTMTNPELPTIPKISDAGPEAPKTPKKKK
jgi:hypothetical protein